MDRSSLRMPTSRLCDQLSLDDFVFLDPTGVSLNPDDTRSNFFKHIGLNETIFRHRLIYRRMKVRRLALAPSSYVLTLDQAEARAGMDRLFSTRKSLQPELMDNPHVLPPYNLLQITESAFQQQVEKIYESSSKQTRGIYDIVGGSNGNWAIRWMLWRVIQSRLAEEARATSSGADTTCSSVYSSRTKSSFAGPPTPHTASTCYTITSLYDYSDSEGWDDMEPRIKIIKEEPEAVYRKPAARGRNSFWADVMNT